MIRPKLNLRDYGLVINSKLLENENENENLSPHTISFSTHNEPDTMREILDRDCDTSSQTKFFFAVSYIYAPKFVFYETVYNEILGLVLVFIDVTFVLRL